MPRGGRDRITSITIDFRHIVQEDAMTILSYASPYNVQLELVGGTKPVLPQTQSPKPGHQSLTHPLYRSSSQSDLNTIERNSRKKLFPSEDSPLKMDNNRAGSPTQAAPGSKGPLPTVHKEHEREPKKHSFKQQMREMIEEKFQTKHADVERKASSPTTADDAVAPAPAKKGHKFGIRVFPPSVNDKLFGKSPTKVQADNENNTNLERKESDEQQQEGGTRRSPSPPVVKKRTKEPKMATVPDVVGVATATHQLGEAIGEFQRQNSVTSSGIRRDASGIPQEVPSFMMQAANAARDNRKSAHAGPPFTMTSSSAEADAKRKGKAPRPPYNEAHDLDESTVTMDTNLSSTHEADGGSASSRMLLNGSVSSTIDSAAIGRMNFSDNFAEEVLNCTLDSISQIEQFDGGPPANRGPSNSSTPKSDRKKTSSTESELMMRTNSLEELHNGQHHDNESDVEQEQRQTVARGNKIELNASDVIVHQSSPSPTPLAASGEASEEEPQDDSNRRTASLGDLSKLEPQKSGTGSASNTLERAQSLEITGDSATTTVTVVNGAENPQSEEANTMVDAKEMATDGLNSLQRNRLKGASAWGNLEDAITYGELLVSGNENDSDRGHVVTVKENGYTAGVRSPLVGGTQAIIVAEAKKIDVSGGGTTTLIVQRAVDSGAAEEPRPSTEEHVSLTTIGSGYGRDLESPESDREERQPASVTNHLVKITGAQQYDTNIPDDVKVSRYPFGSLERPKSDVLKKLLGQKEELENTPSVFISADGSAGEHTVSKIRIEGGHRPVDAGEPISLTLINAPEPAMSDQTTESSQPSPVFTSNTNGVSSINISSLEYDDQQQRSSTAINGFTAMNGMMMPKFSLSDNIVTISTAMDGGGSGSQPSSIIMIDDEKLDFSLQTLDDFDDPLVDDGGLPPPPFGAPMPPPDFSNAYAAATVEPVMLVVEASERRPAAEPPLPPQRSSITLNRRGSGGAPLTNGSSGGGFVTEITLKPVAGLAAEPAAPPQPTAAERCTPHQNGLTGPGKQESDGPAVHAAPPGKPPIVTKKPPKPDNKPTTPPSRIPVERRMSSEHSFIPRNAEIKFTTATYESPSSVPRTPPTRPLGVDQIRSNFERSNSKTEIPVLIRRTSIPSISLSHGGGSHGQAGGSMSNLSSIAGQQQPGSTSTKASPSRIPVFNSAAGSKFGYHDANGGRSPPPPASASPTTTNGGASPQLQQNHHASSPPPVTTNGHHNHHQHNNNNHHLVSNNKVSVSITSIKNQAKHPSGKF
ncbi:uncharacterized protein LOC128276177 [Anopheles cruzii]|uniref:uncharacterized protein LOC128276177 n=1 Tax=Anopheles cruzii TaxID=68878 RepID=UPI0022EC30D0|nr:uncharacterized protein LOC128276177 [Anopheles cruzii]